MLLTQPILKKKDQRLESSANRAHRHKPSHAVESGYTLDLDQLDVNKSNEILALSPQNIVEQHYPLPDDDLR